MQKIVFENNIDEGIGILNGEDSIAQNFGKINYYDNDDIIKWQKGLHLYKVYGIRTFWALQQNNEIKFDFSWREQMLKAELEVCEMNDFTMISFYNHLLFKK